jgi:adenylate cyclase, class 2
LTAPQARNPPLEREIKIPVAELGSVRLALSGAGARLEHPVSLERNWVLDRSGPGPGAGVELLASGQLLRLRQDGRGVRLTYKGPVRYEGGTGSVKVREEREVAVADAATMLGILVALGYRVARRYEKRREEWLLADCHVALDDTPIGAFVEIEGETPERVARGLGLDLARAVRGSYLALWEEHRRSHPEAGADMVFGDAAFGEGPAPEGAVGGV